MKPRLETQRSEHQSIQGRIGIAGLLASEEQKRELLPDMAALKLIGAWGLTEPSNGSDASALQSMARKVVLSCQAAH